MTPPQKDHRCNQKIQNYKNFTTTHRRNFSESWTKQNVLRFDSIFMIHQTKTDKFDIVKIKNFDSVKAHMKRMKR